MVLEETKVLAASPPPPTVIYEDPLVETVISNQWN
jgi:hypothetical protein